MALASVHLHEVDPELSIISTVSCPSFPWMVAAPEWSAAAATTSTVLVGPTASGGMRGPSWIPLCCFQNSCEQCALYGHRHSRSGLGLK